MAEVRRAPSVSVVIPVKDGARHLAEVLAALADQAVEHDLLVVDSGSTDGSVEIARAAGARVHLIAPEEAPATAAPATWGPSSPTAS